MWFKSTQCSMETSLVSFTIHFIFFPQSKGFFRFFFKFFMSMSSYLWEWIFLFYDGNNLCSLRTPKYFEGLCFLYILCDGNLICMRRLCNLLIHALVKMMSRLENFTFNANLFIKSSIKFYDLTLYVDDAVAGLQ